MDLQDFPKAEASNQREYYVCSEPSKLPSENVQHGELSPIDSQRFYLSVIDPVREFAVCLSSRELLCVSLSCDININDMGSFIRAQVPFRVIDIRFRGQDSPRFCQ